MSDTDIHSRHGSGPHIAAVKFRQCSNDLGNKTAELNKLFVYASFNDHSCAAPSVVSCGTSPSLFPALFSSLMLVLNICAQIRLVSLVGYSTTNLLCSNCGGNQFHTSERQRVQLTAPLTRGVAQGLVPGGGQRLHCNPEGDFHQ